MSPKRIVRRTRLYTVLGLIVIASIIFLFFQLFSAEVLSTHSKAETSRQKLTHLEAELAKDHLIPVLKGDCRNGKGVNCKTKVNFQEEVNPKFKWVEAEDHEKSVIDEQVPRHKPRGEEEDKSRETEVEMLNYPRGIPYNLRDSYKPDAHNMFTCLQSKTKIDFSRVNDDYCDCDDSSDEPGTSACPDSKFYCGFQLSWSDPRWVRSGMVNDGVCDCCDGSDEWASLPLPSHVQVSDKNSVHRARQTPCEDQCEQLREQLVKKEKLREEGKKLQKQYIEAAKKMENPGQLYGPNGVFYKLSLDCFHLKFDKYMYRLCPFSKVEQKDGAKATVIGRFPTWVSHKNGRYKLRMGNGDSEQCPQKKHRSTVINFECGLEDKFLSIHEFEVCEYVVEFHTPAAC